MARTLIAIDAGTTGVTCLLYDEQLQPVQRAYREFEQHFPQPGWVEHEAREILDAVDDTLREILASPEADDVQAIGITNQRETVFALDPGSDEALRPGIVWQDRRTAERCQQLESEGKAELIRQRTGLVLDPYFSATKSEWLIENTPHLRERCEGGGVLFSTVDTLILQHLTEQEVLATDYTNASRTMLFDIERKQWDPELCAMFGLQTDWLPEVRPSIGDFGQTSPYLVDREIPIRGVAGDQQAALFGQGGWTPGALKNTYGTGCFLLVNAGEQRPADTPGLLTTLAVGPDGQPVYALEGSLFMGGAVIQWLRDGLGLIETAADSEALAKQVESSGGVFLVPAFAGLGAPYWDADARGAIVGLTRGSNRSHVVRAGLESIAFSNAELIELLRGAAGVPLQHLRVDGGATANDFLMQTQADLGGVRVERPRDVEATARGAALLAGLGAGVWSSPDQIPQPPTDQFEPTLDEAQRAERLAEWRRAVARVRSDQA